MDFDLKALGERTKGFLKTAGAKTAKAAREAKQKADRAAELVAAKCTELTGRPTTAAEVKQAAVVLAGVVALGTVGVAAVSRSGPVTALAGGGGSGGTFGSDFEDRCVQAFAEGGHSLSFYTPHVDSCGTIYSGPNG
ncbi:MAG TPA: hypothetical protein VKD90_04665 [Gemmataceae bacterium]|nr:hypothetical protein [Gemmataceae bacterium]